jgi:hypothetical protein
MPTITDFSKQYFHYVADDGTQFAFNQRHVVGLAAANNFALPGDAKLGQPPHWRLRHIWAVTPVTGAVTNRKRVVIGNPANPLYRTGAGTLNMDGATWKVEGKIGERRP